MKSLSEPPTASLQRGDRGGADLLQTVSAIASVLGFLISLTAFVPFLETSPQARGSLDVLRLLSRDGKAAVLLFSMPIFGVLNTFLVISIARATVSLLRRCGVELYGDASAWLLLLFVLFPVSLGATMAFTLVLFGEVFSALSLVCIAGSLVVTGFCAFRWLQNALY